MIRFITLCWLKFSNFILFGLIYSQGRFTEFKDMALSHHSTRQASPRLSLCPIRLARRVWRSGDNPRPCRFTRKQQGPLASGEINQIKEMLYEADEETRRAIQVEMDSTTTLLECMRIRDESIWQDNANAVRAARQPSLWFTLGCKYGLPFQGEIREHPRRCRRRRRLRRMDQLQAVCQVLEEYNRHKLLAWNKEERRRTPKLVGRIQGPHNHPITSPASILHQESATICLSMLKRFA